MTNNEQATMYAGYICLHCTYSAGVVNGRWAIEFHKCDKGRHPAGTIVCDVAPDGTDLGDSITRGGVKYLDLGAFSERAI